MRYRKFWFLATLTLAVAVFILSLAANMPSQTRPNNLKFKQFYNEQYGITINIPSTTVLKTEFSNGEEVFFSLFLEDKNINYWGYIQLWHIKDLQKFLNNSKEESSFNFLEYKCIPVKTNFYHGFFLNWSAVLESSNRVYAQEYFMQKDNSQQVLRISLFTKEKAFPPMLNKIKVTWENAPFKLEELEGKL
ncbi:hypothetical protein RDV78_03000 [Bacillota bacterium LX-D]|nr:hypothetical protein [Bacillota bacterium LX-D]